MVFFFFCEFDFCGEIGFLVRFTEFFFFCFGMQLIVGHVIKLNNGILII